MEKRTLDYVDKHLEETIEDLKRIVSQKSIAASKDGILECSLLTQEELQKAGFETAIMPTRDPAYPVVYGEQEGDSPYTLLFYNHYDVQPAEPLELWETPPFEPTEKDGYLFGRGISDDKGHFIARLAAIKAILNTTGRLPINLKFCLEGAEEIGSPGFHEFVLQNQTTLAADACIWEGGGVNWDGRPLLTMGVKGILYVELECTTAGTDTHSSFATVIPNPVWRLIWALSTLKDAKDNILLKDFYEAVQPALDEEIEAIRALPDETDNYKKVWGVEMFVGEASGFEFRRRMIMEPTANIDGIISGFTDDVGAKTVNPATAKVKLDFRLVPKQDPEKVLSSLRAHLNEHGFSDIKVNAIGAVNPARTSLNDPFVQTVAEAARNAYGLEPYFQPNMAGTGPQYPIQEILSVPVASCGIDYPGNRIHAPNENIRRDYFRLGILHTIEVIEELGRRHGNHTNAST